MKVYALFFASVFFTQQIHAAIVLSNTDTTGRFILGRNINATSWNATPFTTDGSGYTLNSIAAEIEDTGPVGTLFMEVWSTNVLGDPGATVGRLTLAEDLPTEKTFTGTINLAANTSYFAVVGVDSGAATGWLANVHRTDALGIDFGVDSGSWLLETQVGGSPILESFTSNNEGLSWSVDATPAPLRMTIDATTIPEPSSALLLGLASLSWLAVRRRTR